MKGRTSDSAAIEQRKMTKNLKRMGEELRARMAEPLRYEEKLIHGQMVRVAIYPPSHGYVAGELPPSEEEKQNDYAAAGGRANKHRLTDHVRNKIVQLANVVNNAATVSTETIAKQTGVSRTTVTKVLRQAGHVTPRQRVDWFPSPVTRDESRKRGQSKGGRKPMDAAKKKAILEACKIVDGVATVPGTHVAAALDVSGGTITKLLREAGALAYPRGKKKAERTQVG